MLKKKSEKENSKKAKREIKPKKKSVSVGFYYSFLTVVLLLCLIQISCGAVLNISKLISYQAKIAQLQKTKDLAEQRNKQLKDDISSFSAASSLEAIARNNLKMAGDDEVLVIINSNPKDDITEVQNSKHFKLDWLKKND